MLYALVRTYLACARDERGKETTNLTLLRFCMLGSTYRLCPKENAKWGLATTDRCMQRIEKKGIFPAAVFVFDV